MEWRGDSNVDQQNDCDVIVMSYPVQVCLIPESAHGTNAASAQMAGLNVVYIPTDKTGMVSVDDFKKKVNTCIHNNMYMFRRFLSAF